MKFTKMHGAGNDYVYVDCFKENVENPKELSKRISNRHFGIGADGLVLIKPSKRADCFMDIYNADGSRGRMCGNAVRCVAKYIFDHKKSDRLISVDTLSGVKAVEILQKNGVCVGGRVNMGKPVFNGHSIPTRYGDSIVKNKCLNVCGTEYFITCLSMGNPHCVVFQKDISRLPLHIIGEKFENHEMFPRRINTEFVQVLDENRLKMRVWERGSGETLACGTGACACAVASILNGYCKKNKEITVDALGGELKILWAKNDDVFLTGEAKEVFNGEINI